MQTSTDTTRQPTLAQNIAGEDLVVGEYIAILNDTYEYPSFLWDRCAVTLPASEPVRVRYASSRAGKPIKIAAICLPFVYGKNPDGAMEIIDLRRAQIVRLDQACARDIRDQLRSKK
jgi:hypothetical protein